MQMELSGSFASLAYRTLYSTSTHNSPVFELPRKTLSERQICATGLLGGVQMVPSLLQVPFASPGASQMVCDVPPSTETFFSMPFAKYAI